MDGLVLLEDPAVDEAADGTVDETMDETMDETIVGPRRLSPSGAATFRQCARRWRFRYLEGRDDPPTAPALIGSFVHRILEELLAEPPAGRTEERARLLARAVWPDTATDASFVALELDERRQRSFRWRAWRSIEGYFRVEDPATVDVVDREQRLECEIGGVPFVGIVDRTERAADGLVVTDYKTGRRPSARYCDERLEQVLLYAAALGSTGEHPRRARLLYLGAGALDVEADPERVAGAVGSFTRTWEDIAAARRDDDFGPRPGPLCGWCPFLADCPEGRREVERRLGPAA